MAVIVVCFLATELTLIDEHRGEMYALHVVHRVAALCVHLAADGAGVAGAVREPVQVLHEELPVRHLTRYTGGSAIRIRAFL